MRNTRRRRFYCQSLLRRERKDTYFVALDYSLQTFIDSEFVWRIQGTIKSQLSIPDKKTADWSIVRRRQKRLYEKYKVLVRFEKIDYAFIEAEIIERLTIKIY